MSVTFQISDKRGDAILLVKSEHEDPGQAYQAFGAAVQDAGLDAGLQAFGQGLVQQAAVVNAALQGAVAPPTYGQPAQQYAPAPQMPAAAVKSCPHGPMTRRTGTNSRGPWVGWFCPSPKGTVGQCAPEFER